MTALTASIQPHPQNHIFSQTFFFLKGIGQIRKILNTFHPALSLSLPVILLGVLFVPTGAGGHMLLRDLYIFAFLMPRSMHFDVFGPLCTFQIQPLSGKGWWYV